MKIIVGLALFFSLCGIGNAQTQSSVKEFSDRLSEKQDVLSKISRNVLQMLQGSVKSINKALPSIQSAALVNEVTKLRDANINILQTLEFCKTN